MKDNALLPGSPLLRYALRFTFSRTLGRRSVDFASAEDTVVTKLEWAKLGDSERQYGDAVGIIQIQQDRLDWSYLEHWAAELDLLPLLGRAQKGDPFRG